MFKRELKAAQKEVKAAQQALKNYEQSTKQVELAKRQLEHEIDRIQKLKTILMPSYAPLIRLDLHINQNPTYRVR